MGQASLLIEVLTEELPPKALRRLGEDFALKTLDGLATFRFIENAVDFKWFATPRRLGVLVPRVLDKAPNIEREVPGPPTKANIEAVQGFAKKVGIPVESLRKRQGPKGEIFVGKITLGGAELNEILPQIVEAALKALPVPKVMRWGTGDEQFVRPVHGLVMLHGTRLVEGKVLGLASGNRTQGHRFMGEGEITLASAEEYEVKLRDEGMVIADFDKRKSEIAKQLQAETQRQKANLGDYESLLDEVAALVEFPAVYIGTFDKAFLEIPQECLILTMRQNQKYFPLFDPAGKLLPKFLIVSNMKVDDPRHIVGGNERVVGPRLEDARFFYDQDRKIRLENRVPQLAKVIYHNKLGSQFERVQRIQALAGSIARQLKADAAAAERAAWLSKADLLTGMVGEFPELQGVMGRYYALNDGEPKIVADAIEAHYRPRFAGDDLPEDLVSCAVALADKVDTLVGIFGAGQIPTGDKDPFALRRCAIGVIRILSERHITLDLSELLKEAHKLYPPGKLIDCHERSGIPIANYIEVSWFIAERAKNYLREKGYSTLEIESVFDLKPSPDQYISRLDAARKFLSLPEAASLAEADKRIRNIIDKSDKASIVQCADESKFQLDEERVLLRATRLLRNRVDELLNDGKFSDALLLTAQIHQPVTRFFEKVMVNVDDKAVRTNRFALLHEVGNLTNQVVNISKMAQ